MLRYPVREPRKVRVGTEKEAEHGLGAGLSIGRLSPGAPVKACKRQEDSPANQGGTASVFVALGFFPGAIISF